MSPRILFADDEESWRDLLRLWFLNKDCEVAALGCGRDVLPAALDFHPDCIILDFDLGDRRGSQVCAEIKAHVDLARVPIVILTGLAGKMLAAVAEGRPDHFVVKSANPVELFAVLQDILGKDRFDSGWIS